MIYFIHCPDARAIKIGRTNVRPYERLNQAQVNCPLSLELIGICDGGHGEEAALHLRFADLRIRGEWFKADKRLLNHIKKFPPPAKPARGWHGQTRNRIAYAQRQDEAA